MKKSEVSTDKKQIIIVLLGRRCKKGERKGNKSINIWISFNSADALLKKNP